MALADEIQKPTVSNVFLLEITAALWLRGWVPYGPSVTTEDYGDLTTATSTEDWGDLTTATESEDYLFIAYPSVYRVPTSLLVTAVTVDQTISLTQRSNIEQVQLNPGSWHHDGASLYVHPPLHVSLYTRTWQATVAFYFSSVPKIFNGIWYDPRLKTTPALSVRIEPRFSGVGQIGSGSAALINNDGYFDALDGLQWDAGTARFLMGADTNAVMAYADYQPIGTWRVERTTKDDQTFTLSLREPKTALEKQIPFESYTVAAYPKLKRDDAGKPIPRAYGKVFGAKPMLIDPDAKRFKLAGHAIRSIDAVRIQNQDVWITIAPDSVDLANAEFTLGASWVNNEAVSVDFSGRKNDDGTLMVNAADIVEDLLTYCGETSLNSASFVASWSRLDLGTHREFYRRTLLKPSLYLDKLRTGLDVASEINRIVGSFLYVNLAGEWHYEVFSPAALPGLSAFDTTTVADGSYERETDSSQIYSQVRVSFARRVQDGWMQTTTAEMPTNQHLHGAPKAILKELEVGLWDAADADYYAQRWLTTEAAPLVKHQMQLPWPGFFIAPGQQFSLTYSRYGQPVVLEALEVRHDLIAGKVSIVAGDRRGWQDSFGWWVGDAQAAWSAGATDAAARAADQTSGFWLGEDVLAAATDTRSHLVSRWW